MKHQKTKRKLDRKSGPRRALLKNLLTSLILYEKITTTEAKAKEIRPLLERLITRAKKDTLANRRLIGGKLTTEKAMKKMFEVIAPRYQSRPGGYLRLIKIKNRRGDNAELSLIEFV